MAKVLQMRRGTTAQNDAFTGAEGELTVDTTAKTVRVHDGATAGGTVLAKKSDIPDVTGKADKSSLATVATSGKYSDLSGKPTLGALAAKDKVAYATDITGAPTIPTVPTKVSAFENDAGYLTAHQSLDAYATKASLKAVATSGSYNDLSDKPTIPAVPTKVSAFENDAKYLTTHQSLTAYAKKADLATVATSGSYNDLANKPTIPAAVTVDSALSASSTNPVQNKVVQAALNGKLSTSGGTVTGPVVFQNSELQRAAGSPELVIGRGGDNNGCLHLCPGSDGSFSGKKSASLFLASVGYTGTTIGAGSFCLSAMDASAGNKTLMGTGSGALSWSGTFSATTLKATSDKRKKTNITKISADLSSLNAYRYKFKEPSKADEGFHIGLIAQEVEKVLPDAVSKDDKGFLTLDYNAVVAALVDDVNQLKSEIKQLKAKLS